MGWKDLKRLAKLALKGHIGLQYQNECWWCERPFWQTLAQGWCEGLGSEHQFTDCSTTVWQDDDLIDPGQNDSGGRLLGCYGSSKFDCDLFKFTCDNYMFCKPGKLYCDHCIERMVVLGILIKIKETL